MDGEIRRALIRALLDSTENCPRWRRQEERLNAQIDADKILRKFGQLINERNVDEFAALAR